MFSHPKLLEQALTHASYTFEHPQAGESNQRLEFLGDAILQFILTTRLYELFPDEREGRLSPRRAALSKGAHLADMARQIGLDACLRMGRQEESSGGRAKPAILEDAFEALVGALYLDAGLDRTRQIVLSLYGDLAAASTELDDNPKGQLQERIQPLHGTGALTYDVIETEGADHQRTYLVEARLSGQPLGRGRGSSKRQAEKAAARDALTRLGPGAAARAPSQPS